MTDNTSDDDFIPVVEYMLDNQMALVMFACGIVAGGFFLWLYLNYQKQVKTLSTSDTEPPIIEGLPNIPSLRGQTATEPIQYEGN